MGSAHKNSMPRMSYHRRCHADSFSWLNETKLEMKPQRIQVYALALNELAECIGANELEHVAIRCYLFRATTDCRLPWGSLHRKKGRSENKDCERRNRGGLEHAGQDDRMKAGTTFYIHKPRSLSEKPGIQRKLIPIKGTPGRPKPAGNLENSNSEAEAFVRMAMNSE
jgi:hypothetical protein